MSSGDIPPRSSTARSANTWNSGALAVRMGPSLREELKRTVARVSRVRTQLVSDCAKLACRSVGGSSAYSKYEIRPSGSCAVHVTSTTQSGALETVSTGPLVRLTVGGVFGPPRIDSVLQPAASAHASAKETRAALVPALDLERVRVPGALGGDRYIDFLPPGLEP